MIVSRWLRMARPDVPVGIRCGVVQIQVPRTDMSGVVRVATVIGVRAQNPHGNRGLTLPMG